MVRELLSPAVVVVLGAQSESFFVLRVRPYCSLTDEQALIRTVACIRDRVSDARVEVFVGDISDYDQTMRAVALIVDRFGGLNVLINNAAIRNVASIESSQLKTWDDLIAVNLLGAVNFCKAALSELRKDG
jgi:meso-butanediol dehydrogenase/(S,S)-butanediol dehydrogenase/diacetyl reductase